MKLPLSDATWSEARERAGVDPKFWRSIVGITDTEDGGDALEDKSLFRVLEWGGMEVMH